MFLLDTLQLGMILGSVLILVSVSPVFAEERQCRMSGASVYERGGERQRCDGKDRSGIYP